MDFAATEYFFCLRDDITLEDMTFCVKVVDDILVYYKNPLTSLCRFHNTLIRCRKHGITINANNFIIDVPVVPLCGYVLDSTTAGPKKVKTMGHLFILTT